MITQSITKILDLIYPSDLYCICCGKIIDGSRTYRLCNECMDGIKWTGVRTCEKCGKILSPVNPGEICFNCREYPHRFDKGYTCAEYGTHERALVFRLKYDGRTDIADTIGEIMHDRMAAEFDPEVLRRMYDIVIPVPIHFSKKLTRGFNQAGLIAESFCLRCGMKYDDGILIRTRETHIMRTLGPDQRRENIRGAFEIRQWRRCDTEGARLLLIDDLYTVGATVDEIAGILKEPWEDDNGVSHEGAAKVDVLTFAAGADMVKGG